MNDSEKNSASDNSSKDKEQQEKVEKARSNTIDFTLKSLMGATATILITAIFEFYANYEIFSLFASTIDIPDVPTTLWVAMAATAYCLIAFIKDFDKNPKGFWPKVFKIPVWSELRAFGDQSIAKVSYIGLFLIPIFAYLFHSKYKVLLFGSAPAFPENFKLAYFASWGFSLSLIIYSVACPKQIKKEKKADRSGNINIVLNSKQGNISVSGEEKEDIELDKKYRFFRTLTFLFYIIGISLTIIILIRGARLVYNA